MSRQLLIFATLMLYGQGVIADEGPAPVERDYAALDFQFRSGEVLGELRLHYTTLGVIHRGANGRVDNAVLVLHGTGGSGTSLLRPIFADVLFSPGGLLDAKRYFIILPDGIGHGKSSKPSDGLHARFPQYEYADMLASQHQLLLEGLGVDHLRLIIGTSMGCMHAYLWGEEYPAFMDALLPLACLPVPIAGRNRIWRKMIIDAIRQDPDWQNGEYKIEPRAALAQVSNILFLAGSAPLHLQGEYPTRTAADAYLEESTSRTLADLDANDLLYAVNASRNYDPSLRLESIQAPLLHINSADDFINPPELGIAEREIKRVRHGKFILLPASAATHGHGTHTWAAVWEPYLKELLKESQR
jgi:homoserine O-acetyltransferase/O-succinyltransferase